MANQITEPGNPSNFGHEFNYAAWSTVDNIFTLANVPWNSDYRDVPGFDTYAQLNAYIDGLESPRVQLKGARAKINAPVKIDLPLGKAMKYNYLRVQNGLQPVSNGDEQLTLYYFIVGIREINPNTTELTIQLDIWATFRPTITGVRGFIERGHVGIANTKRMQNYGRDYLSVPEGFDTGSEYQGIAVRNKWVMSPDGGPNKLDVVVLFASDPTAPAYKTVGGQTVPNYTSATGSNFQGIPSGAQVRVWDSVEYFNEWMTANRDTPWRTQSILSIILVPNIAQFFPGWSPGSYEPKNGYAPPNIPPSQSYREMYVNWRDSIKSKIPERYRHLDKFLTAPYMWIELTTLSATPIMLRPENWNHPHATINERANMMPPNARIQYSPRGYNAIGGVNGAVSDGNFNQFADDDGGSYWDLFTQITNFPSVAIVNDGAILALANQAGSIAFAHQSADWSQSKSQRATQTAYDQATSGINLQGEQTYISQAGASQQQRIQNQLARDQAALGLLSGIGGGAGMGAFAGPIGAIGGAAGGVVSGAANVASTLRNIGASNESLVSSWDTQNQALAANQGQAGYIRDSNADLARFASKGDYENALAGIAARVQDTQMTPASISGQAGGELINLVNRTMGVSARWKLVQPSILRQIGEHWLRFGYAVQQFASVPSFKVMSRFTYWKMSETYIGGAHIPEQYRQGLRGILEKGVTVWTDPDDIANVNYDIGDNEPLQNVSLP